MATVEDNGARGWISLHRAHLLLNAVRILSFIALVSVDIMLWYIMVNSFITHTFFFFDLLFYFNLSTLTSFLFLTELPQRILPVSVKCYLVTHWPLLSYTSGLKTLAALEINIGIIILGFINNQDATTRENLGEIWWRMMCTIGTFMIVAGVLNICVTTICLNLDDGGKILSARQIRDPEPPRAPGLKPFLCSRTLTGDLENGLKINTSVLRIPSKVYSKRDSKVQTWI